MKFFVPEEDRKPDPAPVKSNTRAVALVGLGLWVVILAVLLLFPAIFPAGVKPWWPYTCVIAIILGIVFYIKFGRIK